jgi:hypothetical protein
LTSYAPRGLIPTHLIAVTKFGKATGAHDVLGHGVVIVGGVTSLTADITGINDATRLGLSAMGLKTREVS